MEERVRRADGDVVPSSGKSARRSVSRLERQREPEPAAAPYYALDAHPPAMRLDEALADEQSEPGALAFMGARRPIAIEQVREVGGLDAGPCIGDEDANLARVRGLADRDRVAVATELQRVAEQVREHLEDAIAIARHSWVVAIERSLDADATRKRIGL